MPAVALVDAEGAVLAASEGWDSLAGEVPAVTTRGVPMRLRDGSEVTMDFTVDFVDVGGKRLTMVTGRASHRPQMEESLRQAQKMEALGVLAGGIAHDFNNLLAVILADASSLVAQLAEADPRRIDAVEIRDAATRASALTRQLLQFSRSHPVQPEILSVDSVVADLGKMLRRVIGEDIALTVRSDAIGRVHMDRCELEQMILNLVINARDAMPRGGRLTIETVDVALLTGPHVRITVTDTGVGIPPEVRSRIFEPFFTTKPAGQGTGLGLSMIYAVVKHAGGTISVDSEVGHGSTFTVVLPTVARKSLRHTTRNAAVIAGGDERIVVIEDDPTVRAAVARVLRGAGYEVLEAATGDDAVRLIAADPDVDLVISDVVLPDSTGPDVLAVIDAIRPDLRRIFISGYSHHAALLSDIVADRRAFLAKPFTPDELRRKVREALSRVP